MDDLPDVTPVQQQLTRERNHEREQLSEQITILKSILRLDADGIGDGEVLVDVLEQTRTCLDRFSITVQREAINLDDHCVASQAAEFEPDATDAPPPCCSPDGSTRVRSLSGSSTRSSWRSTPSTASTSATSVSPADSFPNHRFSSPPVFESPYTSRFRRFGGSEIEEGDEADEDEEDDEEEDMDMDYEGGPDVSDASFQRLSTILASLQRQAEASLCSPPTIEEETPEDVASFWGSDGGMKGGDISPVPAKAVAHRRGSPSISSQPGSPGLHNRKSLSFSLPHPPGKRASWATGQLFSQFSPTVPPGHVRRRSGLGGHERQSSRDSVRSSTEGKTTETELERTVMEFLEFIGRSNGGAAGEEDVMFRWVWIYMMGGGIVWLVVGWILGWGCNACGEPLVCERR
jgi:hypothetical protein